MKENQKDIPSFLKLNAEEVILSLTSSLADEMNKVGIKKAIVGVSGGVDSALSLYLSVMAVGKENVIGVRLPYRTSSPASLLDAQAVIDATGIDSITVEISSQVDAYFEHFPHASLLRRGNKMARERMSILYDLSAQFSALVIGTGNRSEILLGYGTQYGDTACAINPLGNLYKLQVYQLASYIGVPEEILYKAPSADLWENQRDEEELGFSYYEVDQLLHYMIDKKYARRELVQLSFSESFIDKVRERVARNKFKRKLPTLLTY